MAGKHAHRHDDAGLELQPRLVWVLSVVALFLGVLTVVGVFLLRPDGDVTSRAEELGLASARYKAKVVSAERGDCSYTSDAHPAQCVTVAVRPTQGPDAGHAISLGEYNLDDPFLPDLRPGRAIVVGYEESNGTYFYADQERRGSLLLLFLLFAAVVVLLGRLRGLRALVALGISVAVLLTFVVPAILDGRSPLLVSLVGASAIAFLALYLAHGLNSMTTVALLGALASLGLTAFLAWVFFELASFTGAVSDEATYLPLLTSDVDVRGLLLGGVIFGALGALDDVTVTQASAVFELRGANPTMPARRLYRSGMRIGREHVGSTVNTLLLAYAGASMPLLLLFVLSGQSLGTVANSEVVAVEIVRTLVGSVGLVAAVPLTTGVATLLVSAAPEGSWLQRFASTPEGPRRTAPE